jgi:proline iminopeptidase
MNPDEYTISEYFIEVGNGHSLYVQDWGNPKAKTPIIFLHGGPGGGSKDKHKQVFDPLSQRVVFFDQRGCGKSIPLGSFDHNTTPNLVADIEKIIVHMKLDRVILHGNSWGSSLALFFAIKHPKRVKAMVICGVFTCSQAEIDWLTKGGFRSTFPDVWAAYLARTPKTHHDNPSAYHFKRALGTDAGAAAKSAYAYSCLEGSLVSLDDRFTPENFDDFDPSAITIEMYYTVQNWFMPDRFIMDNATKLSMPVYMVQGRYDMVCPPVTAYELSHKLPDSHLIWAVSGHRPERELWNITRTLLADITEVK